VLNPTLQAPLDVLHKLEREMHRAFHHRNYVHKADYFYNFCITAHSLKDATLTHLQITAELDKQSKHAEWNAHPLLKAATEIANTAKHFELRKSTTTKALAPTRSTVVEVRIADSGEVKNILIEVPDYKVVLPDHTEVPVFEFTRGVIDFWRTCLGASGIPYKPQDEHTFFGDDEP